MNRPRQLIRTLLAGGLVACAALVFAQQIQSPQGDPPGRVGSLSLVEGSVAFAPAGETEWADAAPNRPVTTGDRLWTDRGSRTELHLGSAVLHLDGQTFLDITVLDDDVLQASLNDGSVNARVRDLQSGENFEIDTPNLAFRATQPGDFRIDVDRDQGTTRVVVRNGAAVVYGAAGQPRTLRAGEQIAFAGRDLDVTTRMAVTDNGFDAWAQERNRAEDQSVTARYVPRDVVGYHQLDSYGSWSQDATYGAVWYPRVVVQDWAPYRYGHWDYIAPWGWTWVDDAPWGFAPFHYGRWAQIGPRWAWVPGRLGPRPVYAPALVAFIGGGGASLSFSFGSSPGIGWFPLGPGEVWRPTYRTSTIYVTNVNRYVGRGGDHRPGHYMHQQRPGAWTSVRVEDFNRGRPVNRSWQAVRPADIARGQIINQASALPPPRRFAENNGPARVRALPPPQLSAPGFVNNARPDQGRGESRPPMAPPRVSQNGQPAPQARGEDRPRGRDGERPQLRDVPRPPAGDMPRPQARDTRDDDNRRRAEQAQEERHRRDQQALQQREQQLRAQQQRAQREQQQAEAQQRQQQMQQRQQQEAQERAARQQMQQQRQREPEMGARNAPPPPQVRQQPQAQPQPPQREQREPREPREPREGRGGGKPDRQDDDKPGRGRGGGG